MSLIRCSSCQIIGYKDSEGKDTFCNVRTTLSGCGFELDLYGRFLLCHTSNERILKLVGVPSERWDQDVRDAGYTIVQVIESPVKSHSQK